MVGEGGAGVLRDRQPVIGSSGGGYHSQRLRTDLIVVINAQQHLNGWYLMVTQLFFRYFKYTT